MGVNLDEMAVRHLDQIASGNAGIELAIPVQGRMRVPVRLFASRRLPPTPDEITGLKRIASIDGVAQVVGLPDLHIKPQLETPSSTVTAVLDGIILSLSSPSPGCGMSLALTSLGLEDLTDERIDRLFSYLAEHLSISRTASRREPGLPSMADIRPVLLAGARAAVFHYDLDARLLDSIELHGDAFSSLPSPGDAEEILDTIPSELLSMAGQEFGIVGRGNHFLEVQVIEEVIDAEIASQWGIRAGQAAVMFHADSGRLGAFAGRLYAYRRKNTWRGRWVELRYKTAYHLTHAASPDDLYRRAKYYFTPVRHPAIPAGSPEAVPPLRALAAATNYAFANRVAILATLGVALRVVWGERAASPALLYDVTHNSIRQEEIGSEKLWVHRHNASRALPAGHPDLSGTPFFETGQPLLLPGTSQTSSYLCVATSGAGGSLYSIDHGAGRSAARLGSPLLEKAGATRLYGYQPGMVGLQPHLADTGIDEVVSVLSQAGLARPVARLRPLAVLKDFSR